MTTDDDRHASRVGRVLCDRWSIEGVIVVSDSGITYAAREPDGTRRVLKLLDPELAALGLAGDFAADLQALARLALDALRAPIARDVEAFESTSIAVFEPLAGTCLARLAPLDAPALLDVAEQLLAMLAAARAASIADRSLAPENLVRDDAGVVRLVDPTVARLASDVPDERPSPSDDLGALGLALFRLATGVDAATLPRGGRPTGPLRLAAPALPDDVAALVDRALADDRAVRWGSADEMREAVRRLRASIDPRADAVATSAREHASRISFATAAALMSSGAAPAPSFASGASSAHTAERTAPARRPRPAPTRDEPFE